MDPTIAECRNETQTPRMVCVCVCVCVCEREMLQPQWAWNMYPKKIIPEPEDLTEIALLVLGPA